MEPFERARHLALLVAHPDGEALAARVHPERDAVDRYFIRSVFFPGAIHVLIALHFDRGGLSCRILLPLPTGPEDA